MGPALRPGNGTPFASATQTNQRQLARGRNLCGVKGKWVYLYRAVDFTGATIDFLLSAKRDAAAAESQQSKPSDAASYKHRQACRLPARDCATQRRGCSGGELPTPTGAVPLVTSWNRITEPSSAGSALVNISGLSGSLAHNCRLRGDSYDPQRPSVLECGGCEARSAPSFYCWYVWN
jgi:DDE domain